MKEVDPLDKRNVMPNYLAAIPSFLEIIGITVA